MSEESKESFFTEKVKKMNEFAQKNPWIIFFSWFLPLVALIWKILVWVYWKILFKLWKRLEEIDWTKKESVVFLLCLSFLCLSIIQLYLVLFFNRNRKREKDKLNYFHKELEKKLKQVNRETERIVIKMKGVKQRKN